MKAVSNYQKSNKPIAALPFTGFDHFFWDETIAEQLAFESRNLASADDDENPLDEYIYQELIDDFWDPAKGLLYLSRVYAESFGSKLMEHAEISSSVKFESLHLTSDAQSSPDRIFAKMKKKLVKRLFEMSAADGHRELGRQCVFHFKDRGNYYSSYDPDLGALLAKPIVHGKRLLVSHATANICSEITGEKLD